MTKKRVSTRLTMDEYRFNLAMASTMDMSLSQYLKYKLTEPKTKLDDKQLDKVLSEFSKKIDLISLENIELYTKELLKSTQTNKKFQLSFQDQANLLSIATDIKKVREGCDRLCLL